MQKRPDPMDARLQAAYSAGDWSLLTRLCRQALRKNGRHHKAHRLLGFALAQTGDIESALQAYRQAAALWPQDAELLINYAMCCLRKDAIRMRFLCWKKLSRCAQTTAPAGPSWRSAVTQSH